MSVIDNSYFDGPSKDNNGYGHLTQTSFNLGIRTPDGLGHATKSKDMLESILL